VKKDGLLGFSVGYLMGFMTGYVFKWWLFVTGAVAGFFVATWALGPIIGDITLNHWPFPVVAGVICFLIGLSITVVDSSEDK